MKTVVIANQADPVEVQTNKRVLDAVLATEANIPMACGGKGLCATCHVFVESGMDKLSPVTPRERMSLTMLTDARPTSRLSCPAKVLGQGVRISLPSGRYIDGTADLESLIGRRAEQRILHPVDGRILIEAGKIITRSRIKELSFVDIDIADMKTRSLSVGHAEALSGMARNRQEPRK